MEIETPPRCAGQDYSGAVMRAGEHAVSSDPRSMDAVVVSRGDEAQGHACLKDARVMLRALAKTMPDAERLQLSRGFGERLARRWWEACCARQGTAMELRRPQVAPAPRLPGESLESLAETAGESASFLDPDVAAYEIGLTYTCVLPAAYRSERGIFYTPPILTRRLIDLATEAGVDWSRCRVLDPACGGGAFLAPVARRIIARLPECSPRILLENISNRLRGYESDPFGAWLAQVALDVALLPYSATAGKKTPNLVELCDSLRRSPPKEGFDLVIGNPPYARTRLAPEMREKFARSLFGHANLYGVFTDLALRHSRSDGVIAYVTPTSFLAGEYFKNLRGLLGSEAPPANMDFVAARRGVFDDVLQETLLATYRRGSRRSPVAVRELDVAVGREMKIGAPARLDLPAEPSLPWILPRSAELVPVAEILQRRAHRLADWGYAVSTGPLVWNRHKSQLRSRKGRDRLPLIWAESVLRNGGFEWRALKRNHEPWIELRVGDEWLVSRRRCVLLQRTSAKEQRRRLVATALPAEFVDRHGGFVVENHLNMLKPLDEKPRASPEALAAFLNSRAADQAFRCVGGSVAVSAYEIEALPLPSPGALDELQSLVAENAAPEDVEDECWRLYGR